MNVLVLAPHTDDAELGCGGTIARLVREGHEVTVRAFSSAGSTELIAEFCVAMKVLGVTSFEIGNHKVREFVSSEVREELYALPTPDMVLSPSMSDTHQDHEVLATETQRIFKESTILGYELPWNHTDFHSTAFYRLTEADINRKLESLACYASQADKPYFESDFIVGMARTRGVQSKCEYAEAFDVRRLIL